MPAPATDPAAPRPAAPGPVAPSRSAPAAVVRAEARLFLREPGSLFWVVLFPTVLTTILGLIPSFRETSDELGGRRVIDLYVPVGVLLAMIMSGLQAMPPVLTGYRERGILRRMSATPVRPASLLGAQIVLHGAAALCSAVLVIVVGRTAFGVKPPGQLAGYAVALVLATVSALALGAVVSAVSRTQKIAGAVGSAAFFPAMFTAGVWMPVQTMPGTLRHLVELTPFGAASQALDQAMRGDWPGWGHLGVTALWALVLTAGAARWFRWE
ncbi:ABC transporter permease [Streptomyces sp. NPDC050509]|uniref:ABC transporter permease n=1 Tax=Streptomyces sp. NPDC050509 TaxID=3365620 RepID=UPI00378F6FC9